MQVVADYMIAKKLLVPTLIHFPSLFVEMAVTLVFEVILFQSFRLIVQTYDIKNQDLVSLGETWYNRRDIIIF